MDKLEVISAIICMKKLAYDCLLVADVKFLSLAPFS